MKKKVAVLQSSYLPWKGYFDIIHDVDEFIFYDDVQYTKNDWRNRNHIKTQNGKSWLTVPVGSSLDRHVCDVELNDQRWQKKHWKSLCQYYGKAPYFQLYSSELEDVYLHKEWRSLSELNQYLIKLIADNFLHIDTIFGDSREFALCGSKQERLLSLLKKVGADVYVSGPAAKEYIDEECFAAAGISIVWKVYSGYPEYPQDYPPFDHNVSILDLLFHQGPDTANFIWGWRDASS